MTTPQQQEDTREGVPESDLLRELKISPKGWKDQRETLLHSDDWFYQPRPEGKKGRRKVYLTAEGERKVRIYAATKDDPAPPVQEFATFQISALGPSRKWVFIAVPDGAGGTKKELCAVPIGLKKFLTRGKQIRVEVVSDSNGISYRHERLAGFSA